MNHCEEMLQKSDQSKLVELHEIDHDLQTLCQQAIEIGKLTPAQIRHAAEPLINYTSGKRRCGISSICLCAVTLCAVLAVIFCETPYRYVCAYTRILFIKTLPYWDWTAYYSTECLIENPFYEVDENVVFDEDCEVCEKLEKIDRLANVSQFMMSENILKRDTPVIVTDATDSWPARRSFNLKFLHALYEGEQVLKQTPPCYFASNVFKNTINIRQMLAMAISGELQNWYSHWENCDKSVVRLFRRFYRRPYFIPPMVEAIDRSWMLLSSGYSMKNYKQVTISSSMMWMAQLQGEIKIRLVPRQPCFAKCASLYAVLHEGDTVVWTDFLWTLEYLPSNKGHKFNLAIASGGSFDY